DAVLAQEAALVGGAHGRVQACVVGQGIDPLELQELGGRFNLAPRQAIHDAAAAAVGIQEAEQLAASIVARLDAVADVRAVKRADELARVFQRQPLDDFAPRGRIGGGGQ